ncbi:MAG TPA: hypothetical protein DCQ06_01815 [Myxococcales bacterium]|nr:hypothetical protein [Myxococcales bacterium]HAN30311.1 hypothetical protein [Myxococcales bacterium]
MADFQCIVCDVSFSLPQEVLDRYPGWTPRYCRQHSPKKTKSDASKPSKRTASKRRGGARRSGSAREENLKIEEVFERYTEGPQDGIFTDGSCSPNPGPGGWGVAWLRKGELIHQAHGSDDDTTNNRMELKALIEALQMVETDQPVTVYTDSQLCANTINQWAVGWAARGWKRKSGPIKNLELVQQLYALKQNLPLVEIQWIAAHSGYLGNELADSLATAWMRTTV